MERRDAAANNSTLLVQSIDARSIEVRAEKWRTEAGTLTNLPLWSRRPNHRARSTNMPPSQSYKRRCMPCQHSPDDQTLRLQVGAGEDDVIHLPSGLDRVDCERQEEEQRSARSKSAPQAAMCQHQHVRSAVTRNVQLQTHDMDPVIDGTWPVKVFIRIAVIKATIGKIKRV